MRNLLCILYLLLPAARLLAQDEELRAVVTIPPASAAPGDDVVLSLLVNGNATFRGISLSIDFDESLLEAIAIERAYRRPDGEPWFYYQSRIDNSDDSSGNAGVDEGYLAAAGIFEIFSPDQNPPVGEDTEIFRFHFRVRPDAPAGQTELRFIDGAIIHPDSPPVENVITLVDTSAPVDLQLSPVTVGGLLQIIPDLTLFLRGDSNGDGLRDSSDAITTLHYLFLGHEAPVCPDAADANDDGVLDVSDPVFTLAAVYLGTVSIPPPSDGPGTDPTADLLECGSRGG